MYERLIPEVIASFATPGESERAFLTRVREADIQLRKHYATRGVVATKPYTAPIFRAAYLLRYLGHYSLQLGDVLNDLEGTEAEPLLAQPDLHLAALCGGPCPEVIALAVLHQQAQGRQLHAHVLDLHANDWADCWPIAAGIAQDYPAHPQVSISGLAIDLFQPSLSPREKQVLAGAQVFTCMNCLNELMGVDAASLRRGLELRLTALTSGSLVIASDLASYPNCARGLQMLARMLEQQGATFLLADLDPGQPHEVRNAFALPRRIAWMYGPEGENNFRINVKQLRLAALIG